MKKSRYYFCDGDDESCRPLSVIRKYIQDMQLKQITIYPALMMIGEPYFFCSFHGECGSSDEDSPCGLACGSYEPRNGKNGRCRYSKNCYEPDYTNPIILTNAKSYETTETKHTA